MVTYEDFLVHINITLQFKNYFSNLKNINQQNDVFNTSIIYYLYVHSTLICNISSNDT